MLSDFVDKIVTLKRETLVKIGELQYSTVKLDPCQEPLPEALRFFTLEGLIHIASRESQDTAFVHVKDWDRVALVRKGVDKWGRSMVIARTISRDFGFQVGEWMDQEKFIISLNSWFYPTEPLVNLLRLISKTKNEEGESSEDDGITQTVTVKSGVHLAESKTLPNPLVLIPYRGFHEEIEMMSQFLIRVRKDRYEKNTQFGLFEADGGAWKNGSVTRLVDYLKEKTELTVLG